MGVKICPRANFQSENEISKDQLPQHQCRINERHCSSAKKIKAIKCFSLHWRSYFWSPFTYTLRFGPVLIFMRDLESTQGLNFNPRTRYQRIEWHNTGSASMSADTASRRKAKQWIVYPLIGDPPFHTLLEYLMSPRQTFFSEGESELLQQNKHHHQSVYLSWWGGDSHQQWTNSKSQGRVYR